MDNLKDITFLIPFKNEGHRLIYVIEQLSKLGLHIVCVDDGSTDHMHRVIMEKYESVKMLRLYKNVGKSSAIRMGLEYIETNKVFLCDADLDNIFLDDFERAIKSSERCDMLIMRRMNAPWFVKFDRGDLLFSGERILKVEDLKRIYLERNFSGYLIESAINDWMLKNKKYVDWTSSRVLNTYKIEKQGIRGLFKEFKMWFNIVKYLGISGYIKMIIKLGT